MSYRSVDFFFSFRLYPTLFLSLFLEWYLRLPCRSVEFVSFYNCSHELLPFSFLVHSSSGNSKEMRIFVVEKTHKKT